MADGAAHPGPRQGATIQRHHLADFLERHARDITGRCLEFEADVYTTRFGDPTSVDIIDLNSSNATATIVADLTKPNDVEGGQFDCITCTHVLHLVDDPVAVVRELWRLLAPSGVLLVATPFVGEIKQGVNELWRFTPDGLAMVLGIAFDEVAVEAHGNSLTAAAQLRGLSAHEMHDRLGADDARFAIEVCARARRP